MPPAYHTLSHDENHCNTYRIGHPLAQRITAECKTTGLKPTELVFRYTGGQRRISALAPLAGQSGWLTAAFVTISALETEDHVLFAAVTDGGAALDTEQCQRLFSLPAEEQLLGFILPLRPARLSPGASRASAGCCTSTSTPATPVSSTRNSTSSTTGGGPPQFPAADPARAGGADQGDEAVCLVRFEPARKAANGT